MVILIELFYIFFWFLGGGGSVMEVEIFFLRKEGLFVGFVALSLCSRRSNPNKIMINLGSQFYFLEIHTFLGNKNNFL